MNRQRKKKAGIFLLALMMIPSSCRAGAIQLPSGLITVEEEAFAGIPEIREITLPETLEVDFWEAFPERDETIWVHLGPGETARSLLASGLDVDAETKYRALIINQTYPESARKLIGPETDGPAINNMLTHLERLEYQVTTRTNVSTEGILSAIQTAFGEATEYDVSLFYYSGHGLSGGSLVGCENGILSGTLTPAQLRGALDQIPGRKVLIVDACYSGGLLEEDSEEESDEDAEDESNVTMPPSMSAMSIMNAAPGSVDTETQDAISGSAEYNETVSSMKSEEETAEEEQGEEAELNPADFTDGFLSAFSVISKGRRIQSVSRGSTYSAYYIMTAAAVFEMSYEGGFTIDGMSGRMGLFTYYLCKGCGWNGITNSTAAKAADANGDGLVTFGEAFAYASVNARVAARNDKKEQNAQTNAAGLQSFSPFR